MRIQSRNRYLARKQQGLCAATGCPHVAADASVYCVACLEKQRLRQLGAAAELQAVKAMESDATIASRRAQGVCIDCGAFYIDSEESCCRACYALRIENAEDIPRYNARLRVGLCQSCPAYVEPGTVRCEDCRKARREKTEQLQKEKRCTQCKQPTNGTHKYCDVCRNNNKTDYAQRKATGMCVVQYCGQPATFGAMCDKHREESRIKDRRKTLKRRNEVIAAYGGKCMCPGCSETMPEFLEVDHVNGDGAAHRKKCNIRSGSTFYQWLKNQGYPRDGFQLLCSNCNKAKHIYGECPHVTAARALEP